MSHVGWFCAVPAALFALACGGSTTTLPDEFDASTDGGADASGALDVARDAAGDPVGGDVLAKWQKLTLENASGPCPPNLSCSSSWVAFPDGHIAKTRLGDAGAAQMSPPDLNELDSIVSGQPFLDGMMNGFVCDRPPTDVFVTLRFERGGNPQTQSVTGCVLSGPSGNLPRRVNELVTKY